ncbi:MAG: hypothetical protein R2867_00390 [Caldilineaceae bacterium]
MAGLTAQRKLENDPTLQIQLVQVITQGRATTGSPNELDAMKQAALQLEQAYALARSTVKCS